MELILWRHALAEDGFPDSERALTKKGIVQAQKMAKLLNANLPENCRILVSPTKRTLQTAEALDRPFEICKDVALHASPEMILSAANWHNPIDKYVLVVGHQPSLGRLASLLLSGKEDDWRFKRANVWWFAQRKRNNEVYLRTVFSTDIILPI